MRPITQSKYRDNEEPFGRPTISTEPGVLSLTMPQFGWLGRTMSRKNGDDILGYGVKGTVVKSCVGTPSRVVSGVSTMNGDLM